MEISEEDNQDYDYLFKITLVGNSGVGKSNIAHRFLKNSFNEASDFTIGVEFDEKIITVRDKKIKVQLWDTSGKKMYMKIATKHFRESLGTILVYDVTDTRSFEDIPNWIKEIQKQADPDCKFLLLPNK